MKYMGKKSKFKTAPLYSVIGKVRDEELQIRVFSLTKAVQKEDVWIYPSMIGARKVPNNKIGKVDVCDFGNNNIVYNGYCFEPEIDTLIDLVKSTFISHNNELEKKNKSERVNKIVELVKSSFVSNQVVVDTAVPSTKREFSKEDKEDIEAVNAVLAGHKEKFSVLYQRYYERVNRKYSSNLKYNNDLADDLTADLFTKVFQKLHKYKENYTFNSWITRVSDNYLIDYVRKKRLETMSIDAGVSSEKMRNEGDEFSSFEIRDVNLNPEESLVTQQKNDILKNAIEKLGNVCRTAMRKRFLEEKSYTEIAEEMQIPLGTVKASIFRGRADLKKLIKLNKHILESVLS